MGGPDLNQNTECVHGRFHPEGMASISPGLAKRHRGFKCGRKINPPGGGAANSATPPGWKSFVAHDPG